MSLEGANSSISGQSGHSIKKKEKMRVFGSSNGSRKKAYHRYVWIDYSKCQRAAQASQNKSNITSSDCA
jgi:hypothetical protein